MTTATSKKRRSVSAELERLEAENDQAREASQAAHAEFSAWELDRRRRGIMNVSDNPHERDWHEARERFHDASDRLLRFRVANAGALLAEAAPNRDAAAADIASALTHLLDCCSQYAAIGERIGAVVLATPGLDRQDVHLDARPGQWRAWARKAIEQLEREPLSLPHSLSVETREGWIPPKLVNAQGNGYVGTGAG